jgi:hypothetical protein
MMRPFAFAALYPLLFLAALLGWGLPATWLSKQRPEAASPGLVASTGLAVVMIVGGWLNLFGLVSPVSLHAMLGIGVLLAVIGAPRLARACRHYPARLFPPGQRTWLLAGLIAINAILLLIVILGWLSLPENLFNGHDDLQAYFVFPEKLIQTGSLGDDPFSERRIVSSLGGKYFLDAFVLADLGRSALQFMDGAVGTLLLLMLLVDACVLLEVGALATQFLLMAAIVWEPPRANTTALVLGAALFLAMLLHGHQCSREPGGQGPGRAGASAVPVFTLALLLSGLALLKTSLMPPAAMVGVVIAWKLWPRPSTLARQLSVVAAASLAMIFPWMIALHHSSGTLLYPALGQGFHGSGYGTFLQPYAEVTWNNLHEAANDLVTPLLLLLVGVIVERTRMDGGLKRAAVPVAILCGMVVIGMSTAGYAVYRFAWPAMFACAAFATAEQLGGGLGGTPPGRGRLWAGVMLGVILGAGLGNLYPRLWLKVACIEWGLGSSDRDQAGLADVLIYRRLQSAVPPGAPLLERLDKPFLLDFKRNPVLVDDNPGGASLPGGMPFFRGAEPLAQYLLQHHIRYVAYSYRTKGGYTRSAAGDRLAPGVNAWIRTQAQHAFDFQDNLETLSRSRRIIFDDGQNWVLDLGG